MAEPVAADFRSVQLVEPLQQKLNRLARPAVISNRDGEEYRFQG